jgi:hypothetical protein
MRQMNIKRKGTAREHRSVRLSNPQVIAASEPVASLGAWDLISIGSTDVVLVQVKSRDGPGTAKMEVLREFPCPPSGRNLVHRWRDRQCLPDVKEL